jgi:hypothetical protein
VLHRYDPKGEWRAERLPPLKPKETDPFPVTVEEQDEKKVVEENSGDKDVDWNEVGWDEDLDGPITIKCVCGYSDDKRHIVQCEKCEVWQHIACYYETAQNIVEVHECTDCTPRTLQGPGTERMPSGQDGSKRLTYGTSSLPSKIYAKGRSVGESSFFRGTKSAGRSTGSYTAATSEADLTVSETNSQVDVQVQKLPSGKTFIQPIIGALGATQFPTKPSTDYTQSVSEDAQEKDPDGDVDSKDSTQTIGDPVTYHKMRKRTKTGCLTCRKRRIKCGEEKPTCSNCIKSKRQCEGYNQRCTFKEPYVLHYHNSIVHNHHPYISQVLPNKDFAPATPDTTSDRLPSWSEQRPLASIQPQISPVKASVGIDSGHYTPQSLHDQQSSDLYTPIPGAPQQTWSERLRHQCRVQKLKDPKWRAISDIRGARRAWSAVVEFEGRSYCARLWYDNTHLEKAMEDAAKVACEALSQKTEAGGDITRSEAEQTLYATGDTRTSEESISRSGKGSRRTYPNHDYQVTAHTDRATHFESEKDPEMMQGGLVTSGRIPSNEEAGVGSRNTSTPNTDKPPRAKAKELETDRVPTNSRWMLAKKALLPVPPPKLKRKSTFTLSQSKIPPGELNKEKNEIARSDIVPIAKNFDGISGPNPEIVLEHSNVTTKEERRIEVNIDALQVMDERTNGQEIAKKNSWEVEILVQLALHSLSSTPEPSEETKVGGLPYPISSCIGRRIGTLTKRYTVWEVDGPARKTATELSHAIHKVVTESPFVKKHRDDSLEFDIFVVGRTRNTSQLTIIFSSQNRQARKDAVAVLKQSSIIEDFSGLAILHMAHRPIHYMELADYNETPKSPLSGTLGMSSSQISDGYETEKKASTKTNLLTTPQYEPIPSPRPKIEEYLSDSSNLYSLLPNVPLKRYNHEASKHVVPTPAARTFTGIQGSADKLTTRSPLAEVESETVDIIEEEKSASILWKEVAAQEKVEADIRPPQACEVADKQLEVVSAPIPGAMQSSELRAASNKRIDIQRARNSDDSTTEQSSVHSPQDHLRKGKAWGSRSYRSASVGTDIDNETDDTEWSTVADNALIKGRPSRARRFRRQGAKMQLEDLEEESSSDDQIYKVDRNYFACIAFQERKGKSATELDSELRNLEKSTADAIEDNIRMRETLLALQIGNEQHHSEIESNHEAEVENLSGGKPTTPMECTIQALFAETLAIEAALIDRHDNIFALAERYKAIDCSISEMIVRLSEIARQQHVDITPDRIINHPMLSDLACWAVYISPHEGKVRADIPDAMNNEAQDTKNSLDIDDPIASDASSMIAEEESFEPHLLAEHGSIGDIDLEDIRAKLPEGWVWDVDYTATHSISGKDRDCWTCTPTEDDDPKNFPLTISNAPVVLPVEYQWPPMAGVNPPPDPRPSALVDCTAELSLEVIRDLFITFEGSIGFYLLINGLLQILVTEDFDTEWASSHMPHKYGGLKVCYIHQNMEPTMFQVPSKTETMKSKDSQASQSSGMTSIFRSSSSRPANSLAQPLQINDFIEARAKSSGKKEKFAGRIGLKVQKCGDPYLVMSTHVITEAILAKSHMGDLFSRKDRIDKLDSDWNERVDIWAGNEKVCSQVFWRSESSH